MRTTYIRIASAIFSACCVAACSNDEPLEGNTLPGDEVHFVATLTPNVTVTTRATASLTDAVGEVTVIAPGYANTEATWQRAIYTVTDNNTGTLTIKAGEETNEIKRVALEMPVAAWTTPAGVTPDGGKPSGTVDFTNAGLDNFVGAAAKTVVGTDKKLTAVLPFKHLVGKLTLTIKNNADQDITATSTISFPSIKKQGTYSASLTELPKVRNGQTGEVLSKTLSQTDASLFLPPFGSFAENGTFVLTVDGIDYLGTLNNLKASGKPIEQIEAGQHIQLTIKVLGDHSLDFIGITLAPWNESKEGELNNRPCPGIWGGRDLIEFAKGYNTGEVNTENFIKKYITVENGKRFVRLYTDITVGAGFTAIGTKSEPFGGDTVDNNIIFDGNGYTISGIKTTGTDNQGLFGCTTFASLRNIRLTAATIKGTNNVGILVGFAKEGTTIDNCRITGSSVSGASHIGGVAGYVETGVSITNCTVDGGSIAASVSGKNAGGIAGSAAGTISNCYASLPNGLDGTNAGGLVGNLVAGAILQNCYASPVFTNGSYANTNGALIGSLADGATTQYLYWDIACIDAKCESEVGGQKSLEEDYNKPFNALSGRLVNPANRKDLRTYLFDQLNDNIKSLSSGNGYKGWAIIGTSYLPMLRP